MANHAVKTEWTSINAEGFDGYLALPPSGSGPGLLLWQEIFGVNAHIRGVAEQYALAGFVVLAPDVFWRRQRRTELGYQDDDLAAGRAMSQSLKPDEIKTDVQAAMAALRALPGCNGRTGTIGYCLGGRLAWFTAAWTDVDAAVSYYGGGIDTQLALAQEIQAPMQFHYAGHDSHIPPESIERVRTAMAGKQAEFFIYPEAHHGFNCWARGSYHPQSAALAHGRALTFLAERLF